MEHDTGIAIENLHDPNAVALSSSAAIAQRQLQLQHQQDQEYQQYQRDQAIENIVNSVSATSNPTATSAYSHSHLLGVAANMSGGTHQPTSSQRKDRKDDYRIYQDSSNSSRNNNDGDEVLMDEEEEGEEDGGKRGSSNNGRWTKGEHELFLRGMSLWGRDWKKVQSAVKVYTLSFTLC